VCDMYGLAVGGAILALAYWTGWLYWLVLLYAAFLVTSILLSGTKVGAALLAFASEPRPTTAAGWLELGTKPRPPPKLAIQQEATPAEPRLPLTGKEKKRMRRKRA
jgi:hypothetical protein